MRSPNIRKPYVGLDNDINNGMTEVGRIIRDARVFGLIDEEETCAGWLQPGLEDLWHKVQIEWDKYGCQVSGLPEELRERYLRIQGEAVKQALAAGWTPGEDED